MPRTAGMEASSRAEPGVSPGWFEIGDAMTYLDLFAGVGGMSLGLDRAGMRCVGQVEIDEYCQRVLAKHWPTVPRWNDVRTFTGDDCERPDLVAAGFPCTDVSNAGRRAGIDGEHSGLWFECPRIIRILRPRFVLIENVAAILGRGLDRVLCDLAGVGYDAEWQTLRAGEFGAHHRRARVFILAHRADASRIGLSRSGPLTKGPWSREQFAGLIQAELRLAVPAGSIGGISDGISSRTHRLRALGNAVVPKISQWIGERIMAAAGDVNSKTLVREVQ